MKLERSVYAILQILGISLTDKTHLSDLFDKSNFKNVKDRYDSSEPNLFKVGSINSIFYFLHKAAEPFNCLEQDNLA